MRRLVSLFFILFSVMVSAQQIGYVDFEKIEADISFGEPGEVSGDLSVRLKILKNTDSIYLDAVNMDFKSLKVKNLTSGSEVEFDFSD